MADEVAFGSKEWLDAYASLYNSRPELQAALKDLTARVAYEFTDRPDIAPKFVYIKEGIIEDYGEVDDINANEYVIRANYEIWKAMTLGELDPMNALMAGKVKVTGNMAALLKHAEGFKQTFEVVESIPTSFD
ncbi:MAG: SCP2 sterol-binding domain-containing protein [Candidatus Geothermincolia bacterium]